MINHNIKYIVNTKYKQQSDKNRVLLISNKDNGTKFTFLHPIHAIMLSYFNGEDTFVDTCAKIENELSINSEKIADILSPFLSDKTSYLKYDGYYFTIPSFVLVKNTKNNVRTDIDRQSFLINEAFDFKTIRLNIPRSILFVINTSCVTDCTYCYVDKKREYVPLDTDRILAIIEDAKATGINVFDISGGEFLLHKEWDKILLKMHECGFDPSLKQLAEAKDFIRKNKRKDIKVEWDFRSVRYKNEFCNRLDFEKRNLCTGNITSFVLLPDGKVTVCEGLYWDENFIIGDLKHDCIMDVWNSGKAKSLFKLSKDAVSPESPCSLCDEFDQCRHKLGVCWKNGLYYHGRGHWDYPDPMCPKSTVKEKSIELLFYE